MNIPVFLDVKVVDEEGYLTDEFRNILQQLLQELQQNASNEGLVAPSQTAANSAIIEPSAAYYTLLGDSTTGKLRVKLPSDDKFHDILTS